MPNVEKISIALPSETVSLLKAAVASGEYASASEVVRDALRDWKLKRRLAAVETEELRALVREGMESGPSLEADDVFERLKRKYVAMDKGKR